MCWQFTLNLNRKRSQNRYGTSSRDHNNITNMVRPFFVAPVSVHSAVLITLALSSPVYGQQTNKRQWPPTFESYSQTAPAHTSDRKDDSRQSGSQEDRKTLEPKGTAVIENVEVNSLPPIQRTNEQPRPDYKFGTRFDVRRSSSRGSVNPWANLEPREIERLLYSVPLSSGSAASYKLLMPLLTTEDTGISPGSSPRHHRALVLETLVRMGRFRDIVSGLEQKRASERSATDDVYLARALLGLGEVDQACNKAGAIDVSSQDLFKPVQGYLLKLVAFCSLKENRRSSAALMLELANDRGIDVAIPFRVLHGQGSNKKIELSEPKDIKIDDYHFARLAGWVPDQNFLEAAAPALLSAMSNDHSLNGNQRIIAAENAARLRAIGPERLANIYKRQKFTKQQIAQPYAPGLPPFLQRALFYQSLSVEQDPRRKSQIIKSMLESARLSRLYHPVVELLDQEIESLKPGLDLLSFSSTAVEASVATMQMKRAADWINISNSVQPTQNESLDYWIPLIDIGQTAKYIPSDLALKVATDQALSGRFNSDVSHRLVTVLDALGYNIPIALWEAASRTPQPAKGYLPETGHLSRMQNAATKGQEGRAILMSIAALGPDGAAGANIIALGDTIKTLRSIGHETEARQIGVEALFSIWPRLAGH